MEMRACYCGERPLRLLANLAKIVYTSRRENRDMPTRNVSLTEHFDHFVERSVSSGRYLNASEVVREGLRLLEQKTREEKAKLSQLREASALGFEAIDKGEFRELRAAQIDRHMAAIGKRAAQRVRKAI
jgi:antitoxin ParD1/3/4